ncbi:MAG: response regulator [Chitinophagaceae bacterium]|nr:MAG: response regulator [Chitinophagaceae bacterium]
MSAKDQISGVLPEFLSGGGELGERIRAYGWEDTPLGPVQQWPGSLRTCVRIMLASRQPIWIGWGRELIKLYNDPYKAIVGGKHPWALGRPAAEVWSDIWSDIAPMLDTVMTKDQGTYVESQLLIMERNGYPEETYYTFSYTPVPGDDGLPAGMICFNTDDTDRIISERQLRTLTELGKGLTDSRWNEEVINRTLSALSENPQDFPFVLFYELAGGRAARHVAEGAVVPGFPGEVLLHEENVLARAFREAAATRAAVLVDDLSGWGSLPTGAWQIPPAQAIVLPVAQAGKEPYGFLLVGKNPYRLLNDPYRGFFQLLVDQVATAFGEVHLLDEERKRAEALAEIDRAKTTFFSNISHEFRTPLTLLMGPVEDALNDEHTIPENRVRMQVAWRNVLRLQKLVNTLLDFSRIEAGRLEGRFAPADLSAATADLVSTFRSAVEKAGMQLRYECGAFTDEVLVDPDMWEKIVLNLVSNAFKYSTEGTIAVVLRQENDCAILRVSDTGIGIPADQLDKVFERFHRIESRGGRSQEGTGIGLAMVRELVRLHGGTIEVESREGEGSTFTVCFPVGRAHLPAERISDNAVFSGGLRETYLHEAMRWDHNGAAAVTESAAAPDADRPLVVLADDNADMRGYVERLLAPRFRVLTARDGAEALELVQQWRPDLLLSDIMMPRLDGFGLLAAVRADNSLRQMPVIFLSARAGDEAKIEGLDAGADDYLVKPFSARELIARVDANIKIAQSRKAAEENLRNVIQQSPVAMTMLQGEGLMIEIANERALELWGKTAADVLRRSALDAFPELVAQGFGEILNQVFRSGEPFVANEMAIELVRHGKPETLYVNFIYQPLRGRGGHVDGIVGVGVNVTEQVMARKRLEESEQRLEREVDRRTRELQQSNVDLQQFAHVASHDLKEPLRKVKTFVGRLLDDPDSRFSERSQTYIQKVHSATDRMNAMIEGVLHYSMVNATRQHTEQVDLGALIRQIEQDLELPIAQKGAVLHVDALPVVEGAQVLLYQLFYNLMNNSLKFVRDGVPPVIGIGLLPAPEGFVRIRFRDNGIGFDGDQSEKIFSPFTRLNSKDQYEGTGLGLSLCRRIVQRHGGSITAVGVRGEGAEFDIQLPLRLAQGVL